MSLISESEAERAFITRWIQLATLQEDVPMYREYKFDPNRGWRFDFSWPSVRVACEIEGGVYQGKGHATPKRFEEDCWKYNAAQAQGWVVLRYTPQMLSKNPEIIINQICSVIRSRLNAS